MGPLCPCPHSKKAYEGEELTRLQLLLSLLIGGESRVTERRSSPGCSFSFRGKLTTHGAPGQ
ncbi:unnamed protein product [Staurois parvus]|uniref:Uncharacterized protein n=1 Tax=Staurois parvus TaxID=386267 RepID=A0ABN9FRT8_9NEOB|nr:unnamed protein product [Staurois parvus]